MYVALHSPLLGIVVIVFLLTCYVFLMTIVKNSISDVVGYTFMFFVTILGVFIRGVYPFL